MEDWKCDTEFDAKEKGCGDLIVALFKFFKTLDPGVRVCVSAHDAGASADIAAWCRSTNKVLLNSRPPYFLIEKK